MSLQLNKLWKSIQTVATQVKNEPQATCKRDHWAASHWLSARFQFVGWMSLIYTVGFTLHISKIRNFGYWCWYHCMSFTHLKSAGLRQKIQISVQRISKLNIIGHHDPVACSWAPKHPFGSSQTLRRCAYVVQMLMSAFIRRHSWTQSAHRRAFQHPTK